MTIVMYHYVRNMAETAFPDVKGLTIDKFVRQLNYIEKNYTVIALEGYLDFLKGKKEMSENACLLTFDDGLSDHYYNVFPILSQRRLSAVFSPLTQPLTELVVCPVHKAHFLLAKIGSNIFAAQFNQIMKSDFPELVERFMVDNQEKKQRKYRWDDALTANLKYSIAQMPLQPKIKILNQLFAEHFINEKAFSRELYLDFAQMKEMLEAGMSFGGHTHTHPALSQLSRAEQTEEIKDSKEILENGLKTKISLFSYPYGDFNETSIDVLKNQGFQCALTSDFGVNNSRGANPFALKRLDANDLPS